LRHRLSSVLPQYIAEERGEVIRPCQRGQPRITHPIASEESVGHHAYVFHANPG